MPNGRKSNDWRRTLVKAIAWVMALTITAATVLVTLHEDPSKLADLINAMFDGIVQVLTLLFGGSGLAVAAYQSAQIRSSGTSREPRRQVSD